MSVARIEVDGPDLLLHTCWLTRGGISFPLPLSSVWTEILPVVIIGNTPLLCVSGDVRAVDHVEAPENICCPPRHV